MRQNESIRELNAAEIDEVAGGLSATVSAGAHVNASDVLGAVSGLTSQAGSLVSSLLGGALGSVGGVATGL